MRSGRQLPSHPLAESLGLEPRTGFPALLFESSSSSSRTPSNVGGEEGSRTLGSIRTTAFPGQRGSPATAPSPNENALRDDGERSSSGEVADVSYYITEEVLEEDDMNSVAVCISVCFLARGKWSGS